MTKSFTGSEKEYDQTMLTELHSAECTALQSSSLLWVQEKVVDFWSDHKT